MTARLPAAAALLLALAFAAVLAAFVRQPGLATFADDSASYLVMAQAFSPQAAAPAVAEAFPREAAYPPLFPLLLALGGAAHDLARAHVLAALPLAGALLLAFLLGLRWLESRGAALAAMACVALLPGMWVNAKGILSEPLFCLLLLAVYLLLDRAPAVRGRGVALGVGLAALVLTRAAALPMVAAHAAWALSRRGTPVRERLRGALPALAAFAAYGFWMLLRPSAPGEGYASVLGARTEGLLGGGALAGILGSLLRQANAMVEGWAGSLLLFWIEGRPLTFILASAVGLAALAGLALRLARGKADGWMSAAYLATLLAWPFSEQMERFLFPLLPVLVLYAFLAAGEGLRAAGRRPALGHALLALLVVALALPPLAFLRQRAQAAEPAAAITDWYRTPDLGRARARAQVHLDLLADMEAIRAATQPGERVMWVAPGYVALLAGRRALPAPDQRSGPEEYRRALRESGADYLFLSRYHPRDTIHDTAWQAGVRALLDGPGRAQVAYTHAQPDGTVSAILLRVKQ